MATGTEIVVSPFARTVPAGEPEEPKIDGFPTLGKVEEIFKPGGTANFIKQLRLFVGEQSLDISTEPGRDFVRSFAHKLSTTKTFAVKQVEALIAEKKKYVKDVDSERIFFEKQMDAMRKEVRGPLTTYEDREKERAADFETKLGEIYDSCLFVGTPTIEAIRKRLDQLKAHESFKWEEYEPRALSTIAQVKPSLEAMLAKAEQAEADRIELEELKKADAARKQKERDDQIAKEATERAEKKALEAAAPKKTLWLPSSVSRAVNEQMAQTAPMAAKPVEPTKEEVIPPREFGQPILPSKDGNVVAPDWATTNIIHHRQRAEQEIYDALVGSTIDLDPDQASNVIAAIRDGKIPYVKILY